MECGCGSCKQKYPCLTQGCYPRPDPYMERTLCTYTCRNRLAGVSCLNSTRPNLVSFRKCMIPHVREREPRVLNAEPRRQWSCFLRRFHVSGTCNSSYSSPTCHVSASVRQHADLYNRSAVSKIFFHYMYLNVVKTNLSLYLKLTLNSVASENYIDRATAAYRRS
jgi:hypothetical protein